jgi:replicative DNA helicase
MRTVDVSLIPALNAGAEIKEPTVPTQVLTKEYCDRMGVDIHTFKAFLDSHNLPSVIEQEDTVYKVNHTYDIEKTEQFGLGNKGTINSYFDNMKNRPQKISTGIPELDEVLSGGFRVGLNIVGGIPNLGKTTLLINSAINMSSQGTASIYLTHDMRGNELMDKVFSKVSYDKLADKGYTLTDISYKRELLKDDQKSRIVISEVMERSKLLTIIDMLDTKEFIRQTGEYEELQGLNVVERAIKIYTSIYRNPVFFVDSLQQMALYLGLSAKDGIDKILMMFKEYSAKYKAAIVLVSTLSRSHYNKDLTIEAFKESGNIEYDADSIFVLQPKNLKEDGAVDMDDFKSNDFRDVTLKCLKSRDSGFVSKDITLYAPFCSFIEYDEERSRQQRLDKSKAEKSDGMKQGEVVEKPTRSKQQASKPRPVNTGFELQE